MSKDHTDNKIKSDNAITPPKGAYGGLMRLQMEVGPKRFIDALDALQADLKDHVALNSYVLPDDGWSDADDNCRHQEIGALFQALTRYPLVTLYGETGVGKTFVAARVAEKAQEQMYDVRIISCPRLGVNSPASLMDALRWTVAGQHNRCHSIGDVMSVVAHQKVMLIIDGLDRALENKSTKSRVLEQIKTIISNLDDASGQRLLLTSRTLTGLKHEYSIKLEPLSRQCFEHLLFAEMQHSTEGASKKEMPTLVQDKRDGYIPLSAKLLACQMEPTFNVTVPDFSHNDGPDSSLTDAQDLVLSGYHSLSTTGARKLFLWFSLFSAGMNRKRLAELFGRSSHEPLAELERKCLVHTQADDGSLRIVMEEIVRRTSEKLLQGSERIEAETKISAYYQTFVRKMTNALCGLNSVTATASLLEELANIHAAIDRAERSENHIVVLALVGPMKRFYWWTCSDEGEERLKQGERAATAIGDDQELADCLLGRADCIRRRGQLDEALRCYKKAKLLYSNVGDPIGKANCIKGKAEVHRRRANLKEALDLFSIATKIYEASEEKTGLANCLKSMGDTYRRMDDLKKAKSLFADALLLYKGAQDLLGIANCTRSEAEIYRTQARYEEALESYNEAEKIYKKIGARLGETHCIRGRGDLYWLQDDYVHARHCYEEAEKLYREVGDTAWIARSLYGWGDLYRRAGNLDLARMKYQEAEQTYAALGNQLGIARCQRGQGDVSLREMDLSSASRHYRQAWNIAHDPYSRLLDAECLRGMAGVRLMQASHETANMVRHAALLRKAERLFEWSEKRYAEIGAELGRHHCMRGRADIYRATGNGLEAIALYEVALKFYEHIGDQSGKNMVRKAMDQMNAPT